MTTRSFNLDDDQLQLQQTLRTLFGRHSAGAAQVSLAESGNDYDRALWKLICTDLGLVGIATPEEFGGAGASLSFLGVVLMETGRALYSGPYFSTAVLACQALIASEDDQAQAEVLPRITRGEATASLAGLADLSPDGRLAAGRVRASATTGGWHLNGAADHVWEGHYADILVVLAHTDDGVDLFLVEGDSGGVERTAMPGIDLTRTFARVSFTDAPARHLGSPNRGTTVLAHLSAVLPACLAAEQVGAAEHCVSLAVEYAKQRHQFGRPIGSFQAVKHQLVNAYMDNESAKCASLYALAALDASDSDASLMAHVAKAAASDAFYKSARAMIQTLGGIGYTWEHPAHLYLRRAVSSREVFGSPSAHRRALADTGRP
jgi:alkylation response protein AidB-like acyl-CoA dehydrogenase